MRLKVYLATMNMSVKDFSKSIPCDCRYMSRINNGFKPGKHLAKIILHATNGQVDVLKDDEKPTELVTSPQEASESLESK